MAETSQEIQPLAAIATPPIITNVQTVGTVVVTAIEEGASRRTEVVAVATVTAEVVVETVTEEVAAVIVTVEEEVVAVIVTGEAVVVVVAVEVTVTVVHLSPVLHHDRIVHVNHPRPRAINKQNVHDSINQLLLQVPPTPNHSRREPVRGLDHVNRTVPVQAEGIVNSISLSVVLQRSLQNVVKLVMK